MEKHSLKEILSIYRKFLSDTYNIFGTFLFYLFSGELIVIFFLSSHVNIDWKFYKLAWIIIIFSAILRYSYLVRFFKKELKKER